MNKLFLNIKKGKGMAYLFILLVVFYGTLVLIGWQFSITALKRPLPQLVAMNPLTALLFVLCGFSFFLVTAENKNAKNIFCRQTAGMVYHSVNRI
ncbi:MAG: hypothetical protein JST86_09145 [Bacteroidetes bacterium]|nr:hypothetical protein [Bacteroidota bacterium]